MMRHVKRRAHAPPLPKIRFLSQKVKHLPFDAS